MQALVDGAAFAEKIWEVRDIHVERDGEVVWDGPALVYKEFRYNKITTIVPSLPLTEDGSFNGYYQKKGFDKVHVPAWKAWLYPHNFLRAGFWGEPALNHVYAPWFFKCKLWVMRMLYYSKHAAPTKIGWAPPGRSTNEDGDEVDNLQWLGDRLHKTDEFTTLAMPMVRDDRGNKLWDITQLDVTGRGDLYARGIEALNDEILRGLVCVETPPERGGARTYYEGLGRLEAYLTACDTLALDFLSYVNQYAVRQLVVDHFGERAPECYVRHNPLFSLKRRVLYNVLQTAINAQHHGGPQGKALPLRGTAGPALTGGHVQRRVLGRHSAGRAQEATCGAAQEGSKVQGAPGGQVGLSRHHPLAYRDVASARGMGRARLSRRASGLRR